MRRFWLMILPLVVASCSGGVETADSTTAASSTSVPGETDGVFPADVDGEIPAEASDALDLPQLEDVSAPEWEPETRTEELLMELAEDEQPSVQQAIDALALVIDGVPGATPTDLPPGEGIGEITLRRMVRAVRDQIVGDQAAVVDAFLDEGELVASVMADGTIRYAADTPPTASGDQTSTTVAGFRRPAGVSPEESKHYAELLAEAKAMWDQHLPTHPTYAKVDMVFSKSAFNRPWADPTNGGGCQISIPQGFRDQNYQDDILVFYLTHELFHCFQYAWAENSWPAGWVVEGSAQWASIDLFRSRPFPHEKFYGDFWFTKAEKPLQARDYYAWPLYENARLSGHDVYGDIKLLFANPSTSTAQQLAAGHLDGDVFRKDWSSRTLRANGLGSPWELPWPVPDAGAGPHDNAFVTSRGVGTYQVKSSWKFAQLQLDVVMNSDVGLVVVTPAGSPLTTWTAEGTVTVGDGQTQRFCFDPGGCSCPGDATSDAIQMADASMIFSYPASQDIVKSTVIASPWDPEQHCRETPAGKDGASNGDPHLVTFDGLPYDVMTLGEFVNVRDPEGGFEVQTRHEAFGAGAGTTAVAIDTGSGRLTVTMGDFSQIPTTVVRVDGVATTESSFALGEVEVTTDAWSVEVRWPDGTTVTMDWFMGWFVLVSVPPERAARLEGLLGSGDDDLSNDLRFPDGQLADTSDAEFEESEFVLAWAVDESTSLFDYEPGQSVATFRIPHPDPELSPLDPEAIDQCESALGEMAAAHEVSACAYDVSVTGETVFVDGYAAAVEARVARVDEPTRIIVPATEPTATTQPGAVAESRSGEPTLVLTADGPSGVAELTAGTVLVARSRGCPADVTVDLEVGRADSPDDFALAHLCDPSGLGAVLAGGDDEWFDGEAYVWIPGSGRYEVRITTVGYDPELQLMPIDVYADPTPAVLDADAVAGGDERILEGIGDTVVYLSDPRAVFAATGFDQACAVAVYWTRTFPDPEPFALDSCEHATSIDFPPTDTVVPTVVFNRTDSPIAVSISPS